MKTRLAILILILVAVLLVAAPVSATREWVGERILVDGSAQEFPAGDPFHIRHGWAPLSPGEQCFNGWDFRLSVLTPKRDTVAGVPYVFPIEDSDKPPDVVKLRVYAYRKGMSPGVVAFRGTWFAPCQTAVDIGWWTEDCRYDCQPVPVHELSTTVTFTEE